MPSEPATAPAAPPAEPQARLNVEVPVDAVVIINGRTTTSTGSWRSYVTRGLDAAESYRYEVRAEVDRDGQTVSETKVVELGGNETVDVSFTLDSPHVAIVESR